MLLVVVTDDPNWADWSVEQLEAAALHGPLLISDVVYAELAVRYERIERLEAFLAEAGLDMAAMPRSAPFLAGKVSIARRAVRAPASCRTSSSARQCRRQSTEPADTRYGALSDLFSDGQAVYTRPVGCRDNPAATKARVVSGQLSHGDVPCDRSWKRKRPSSFLLLSQDASHGASAP